MPRTPRVRTRGNPDRLLVVMSDIEMGAGGAIDDFPNSPWLADRLRRYLAPPYDELHLELVFNGDTFDLLKTSFNNAWPHHITAEIAAAKMARVAEAHPEFFRALREILDRRGGNTSIHFIAGNHDLELFFPEVQSIIRDLTTHDERVRFHGHELELGRVRIEHGSQLDPLFRVEVDQPFLEHNGQKILNLGWASVALLDVAIPHQPLLHHLDRLKPKNLVLELLPEVRQLMTGLAWTYWTREYWRDFFGSKNPIKRVSWTMFKEVVWRFVSRDVDVAMEDSFAKQLRERDDLDLIVVGHQHEPGWWSFGDRKALRTGALRDEFMLSDGGNVQTPINKTWAEAFLAGDHVVRSHLVEEVSPMRPPGTMTTSIFDLVPGVLARLASPDARAGLDDEAEKNRAALESSETKKEP
jgi:UDP-2,3-diacylglucosamine pyrophosphatase LpxH